MSNQILWSIRNIFFEDICTIQGLKFKKCFLWEIDFFLKIFTVIPTLFSLTNQIFTQIQDPSSDPLTKQPNAQHNLNNPHRIHPPLTRMSVPVTAVLLASRRQVHIPRGVRGPPFLLQHSHRLLPELLHPFMLFGVALRIG